MGLGRALTGYQNTEAIGPGSSFTEQIIMARCEDSESPRIRGFPPVTGQYPRVLILGSMPSVASLAKHEYYGLPRNAFWRIMGDLFGAGINLPYPERLKIITAHGVALWDVVYSCYRPGSLDSAIDDRTVKTNDFEMLFRDHCTITDVFFNGKKAANIFSKRILPAVEAVHSAKKFFTLPSTSPAMASMSYAEKLDQWAAVKVATG